MAQQEQTLHRCGLCNKAFDRRDLRDRHRRRCIHTFAKPRKSKRKSCVSCAASKLSCDLGSPSCSRCTSRNTDCQYPSSASIGGYAEPDLAPEFQIGIPPGSSTVTRHLLELPSRNSTAGEVNLPRLDDTTNGNEKKGTHEDQQAPGFDSPLTSSHSASEIYLLQPPLASPNEITKSREFQPATSPSNDGSALYANNDTLSAWGPMSALSTSASSNAMEFDTLGFQVPWSDSIPSIESSSQAGWMGDIFQTSMDNSNSFDLLGSFGIPKNITNQSQISGTRPFSPTTFSTVSWKPPLSFGSVSNRPSLSVMDSSPITTPSPKAPMELEASRDVSSYKRKSHHIPQKSPRKASEKELQATCPFHKMGNDDDLIRTMCGYPQTMLKRGQYPPFVHHRIYRCAEGDVLEPLANAFCCVSAFNAALPSSETFVQTLMNAERDRLIKTFRPSDQTDVETLAAVHAMCIYQIVGYFMSTRPEATRTSELQHPFFLKMTRRLIASQGAHTLTSSTDPHSSNNSSDTAWRKWIVIETLRRTIFLVHMINLLSCRSKKQDPYYFENLDDELVLNLPLPAVDRLWKASTAEEWRIANSQERKYAWENFSVKMLLDCVENSGTGASPSRSIDVSRPEFENLPEFTKLLVACIKDKG